MKRNLAVAVALGATLAAAAMTAVVNLEDAERGTIVGSHRASDEHDERAPRLRTSDR